LGKTAEKKTRTLTIIKEVTVRTMMHELSSGLVGAEVGGSNVSDVSLRECVVVGASVVELPMH
jgi:hypothetical protein